MKRGLDALALILKGLVIIVIILFVSAGVIGFKYYDDSRQNKLKIELLESEIRLLKSENEALRITRDKFEEVEAKVNNLIKNKK